MGVINLVLDYSCGFFDGAEQGGFCGAGMTLYRSPHNFFQLVRSIGEGTNIRADFLALWALLWFANYIGINSVLLMRNSKCIINWAMGKAALSSIYLEHWIDRVKKLIKVFEGISFKHIYRDLNKDVDRLSKLVIGPMTGNLLVKEYVNGVCIRQSHLPLF